MINIRGHEYDYGVYDIDTMKRAEAADAALQTSLTEVGSYDGSPTIEQQEAIYAAYAACFDEMLGLGSLDVILDGKINAMDAIEAYYDLRDTVLQAQVQRAEQVAARAQIPSEYDPDKIRM